MLFVAVALVTCIFGVDKVLSGLKLVRNKIRFKVTVCPLLTRSLIQGGISDGLGDLKKV